MSLEREHVNASDAPTPLGYSHAVRMGPLLFISGQLPVDRERRLVAPGDLAGQTRQVLENLTTVLKAAGASWSDVAKLTIFVLDMDQIGTVREVRQAFYAEQDIQPPASTAVGVAGLAIEGALIEIEAYAVVESPVTYG
jgi:reactive intermediate/imine deaminase